MSSAEAEYVALSASCAQVMWMRTQLQRLCLNYNKIPLYCSQYDSVSPRQYHANPCTTFAEQSTAILVSFHKGTVENVYNRIYFVRTEYQLANMFFTKALHEDVGFKYLSEDCMRYFTPTELEFLTKEPLDIIIKHHHVKTVVTVSQSTKVDSLPHVHAHSTKTSANSDLKGFQDKCKRYEAMRIKVIISSRCGQTKKTMTKDKSKDCKA
ncbi:hypothetical protein Tco_0496416 [Tanacetum coccineum]|uniref:Retrovirus-related Pol polyprotein from transposon TNT 1-94 n=1 Tax=Tanacetum coccineum TaxID=301880 RepID=A0ABQ5G7J6_9ASTR